MTDLDVLLIIRGLLDRPQSWGKGAHAWNEDNRQVRYTHPRACRFSLDGAFYRVQHITHARIGPAYNLLRRMISREVFITLATFNDARGTTHGAVLDLIDRGIRHLGGTPPPRILDEE